MDRGEGDIAGPLGTVAEAFPDLSIGCYPFQTKTGSFGANVVIRGTDAEAVTRAKDQLEVALAG